MAGRIPISEPTPIHSAVFTVYALGPDGVYKVFWQSPVLSHRTLTQIADPTVLRDEIIRQSGLGPVLAAKPIAPPIIVGAMKVRPSLYQTLSGKFPKPADLGGGWGVTLGELPVGGVVEGGIQPARASVGAVGKLAHSLVAVNLTRKGNLRPLVGTPRQPPNLFSPGNVAQTYEYKLVLQKLKDVEEPPPPNMIGQVAYVLTLKEGVTAGSIRWRPGGMEFDYTRSTFVSPTYDPLKKRRASPKKKRFLGKDLFDFAWSICRATETCRPLRYRPKKLPAAVNEDLLLLLEEYGIEVPAPDDLLGLHEALVELKRRVAVSYRHKTRIGKLKEQAEGEGASDYLSRIAKLNGRRPRRRRRKKRVRRNRARRTRRNPLSAGAVDQAVEYATSRRKERDPGSLVEVFRGLREESDPMSWAVTRERVDQLFPRKKRGRRTWTPSQRFSALQQYDLVSRVGPPPPGSEVVRQGKEAALDTPMLVDDPAALRLVAEEAQLSLEEAARILEAQKKHNESPFTMMPSSAICKLGRTVRLKGYSPPSKVLDAAPDVLIWMSPRGEGGGQPRVMSYRRRTHVDCDMIGSSPEELPVLLGRALQSSLYWVTEKPRRKSNIYLGRVGEPYLYLVLPKASTAPTLAEVSANLDKAKRGEPGYRVDLLSLGVKPEQDLKAYQRALKAQMGARAFKTTVKPAPRVEPVEPRPQRPKRPATPPSPWFEVEEEDESLYEG